jgi:hypothetical protein
VCLAAVELQFKAADTTSSHWATSPCVIAEAPLPDFGWAVVASLQTAAGAQTADTPTQTNGHGLQR